MVLQAPLNQYDQSGQCTSKSVEMAGGRSRINIVIYGMCSIDKELT